MARYKKLEVWQKAHALALNVYRVAAPIKGAHHISLRSQLIRAAMSIPTNIVEGRGQQSDKDFARFLRYSISSASELEYHLDVARDIGIINRSDSDSLVDQTVRVRKMLHGLVNRITEAGTCPPSLREERSQSS
ncbi:MAG: four helix bundle protein [Gemmatimonadaceae bacterium]|nr:four helix bundle protein [Gemmatimonadaceae bacterium]